jgi:hypothetical protein
MTAAVALSLCYPRCRPSQAPTQAVQYPTHVPLNIVQKGAVAGLSALGALMRCVSWLTAATPPVSSPVNETKSVPTTATAGQLGETGWAW